jgi:hypothetical protein
MRVSDKLREIAEAMFLKSGLHPHKLVLTQSACDVLKTEGNELREWDLEINNRLPQYDVILVAGNGRGYAEIARFVIFGV